MSDNSCKLTVDLSENRVKYKKLAEVYSIINALDHLVNVWIRGGCYDEEYLEQRDKLILEFKRYKPSIDTYYPDIRQFFKEYLPENYAAYQILINDQIIGPSICSKCSEKNKDINSEEQKTFRNEQLRVAAVVRFFITTIDGLNLNLKIVDEIYPHLKDLQYSLDKITDLPNNFSSKKMIQEWMTILTKMEISDELTEEQIRELTFDLENGYSDFVAFFQEGKIAQNT